MYIVTDPSKFGNCASHTNFYIIRMCAKCYNRLPSLTHYIFTIFWPFFFYALRALSVDLALKPLMVGGAFIRHLLYSSSASIAAEIILLLTRFEEFKNIFVSFGRQCPPIPCRGSRIFTFHFVLRDLRSSSKSTPLA